MNENEVVESTNIVLSDMQRFVDICIESFDVELARMAAVRSFQDADDGEYSVKELEEYISFYRYFLTTNPWEYLTVRGLEAMSIRFLTQNQHLRGFVLNVQTRVLVTAAAIGLDIPKILTDTLTGFCYGRVPNTNPGVILVADHVLNEINIEEEGEILEILVNTPVLGTLFHILLSLQNSVYLTNKE